MRPLHLPLMVVITAACGGSPPPHAEEATASSAAIVAPESEPTPSPPPPPLVMPTACAPGDADTCMPGVAFADRVCAASHADVALALFAKGSPWTRIYLRGDVDGSNAEGGASTRARLLFDEEVLVLKRR